MTSPQATARSAAAVLDNGPWTSGFAQTLGNAGVERLGLAGQILFEDLLSLDNGLGLYSEDILPETRTQSGNFPQTYSHVGLINAAFRLSPLLGLAGASKSWVDAREATHESDR